MREMYDQSTLHLELQCMRVGLYMIVIRRLAEVPGVGLLLVDDKNESPTQGLYS
jgi:hypothetical protein